MKFKNIEIGGKLPWFEKLRWFLIRFLARDFVVILNAEITSRSDDEATIHATNAKILIDKSYFGAGVKVRRNRRKNEQ